MTLVGRAHLPCNIATFALWSFLTTVLDIQHDRYKSISCIRLFLSTKLLRVAVLYIHRLSRVRNALDSFIPFLRVRWFACNLCRMLLETIKDAAIDSYGLLASWSAAQQERRAVRWLGLALRSLPLTHRPYNATDGCLFKRKCCTRCYTCRQSILPTPTFPSLPYSRSNRPIAVTLDWILVVCPLQLGLKRIVSHAPFHV